MLSFIYASKGGVKTMVGLTTFATYWGTVHAIFVRQDKGRCAARLHMPGKARQ